MISRPSVAPLIAVLVTFGGAGCASETGLGAGVGSGASGGSLASGGSSGSGGSGGSSGSTGGSGGGVSCEKGPGQELAGTPQWVSELSARLFDPTGAPAPNVPVVVCGFGACGNFGSTSDQGEVCTPDKATGLCAPGMFPGLEITRPAFKYGLGIDYVKFAQALPSADTKHAIGDVTVVKLPDVTQGASLLPGASATSNGVSLTLAPGTSIEFDILVFDTPELQKLRAAPIPQEKTPPAVDESAGFEILVGMTPTDTTFCPHAALSVPNTAGWAAGTAVEFWLHGVTLDEQWAPYGGWGKVSAGSVSSDGSHVVTNEGEGIPVLGVIGIRKSQ